MAEALEALAVGEAMVALVGEQPGVPLAGARSFGVHVVGAEANVAVGLARLGHEVGFTGRVGADPFGEAVRRSLRREGVRTDWLFSDERPTGLLFRNLSGPAGAEVVYRRSGSAGAALRLDDVLRALDSLGPGGFFVITGVTAAVCGTVAVSAATAAASGGYRVVLDVNLRTRLWTLGDARASIAALVPSATLVVGSAPEAAAIMETDDVEMAAHRLLALGPDMVVLRTSSLSAICYSRSEREPVTVQGTARDPVDVVGAGDAFLAGLLSGLLDLGPDEIEACLGRAHRCGAAAVGAIGDTEGLPTRAELETLEATADGADVRR